MAFKALDWLLDRGLLWSYKKTEVARFGDIILADIQQKSPHFKTTLLASLQLIEDCDERRFRRIQRHIKWIVNIALGLDIGANYDFASQTCSIDFIEPRPEDIKPWYKIFYAAEYAKVLIHEATHGLLISRGIPYNSEFRARVEEICVLEENRFIRRAAKRARDFSDEDSIMVMENLESEFNAAIWEPVWNASAWQNIRSTWNKVKKR